ncbi:MAG: hypothetical protein QXG09_03370 [Candidatus Bathyarchaeia archaeon]
MKIEKEGFAGDFSIKSANRLPRQIFRIRYDFRACLFTFSEMTSEKIMRLFGKLKALFKRRLKA